MTAAEAWEVKTRLPNLGGRGEVARLRLPSETSGAGLLGVSGECDMKLFPLENITGGLGRRSHFRSPCLHPVLSPPLPGGRPPCPPRASRSRGHATTVPETQLGTVPSCVLMMYPACKCVKD